MSLNERYYITRDWIPHETWTVMDRVTGQAIMHGAPVIEARLAAARLNAALASSGGLHEPVLNGTGRVGHDEQHGFLSEDEGDLGSQLLGLLEDGSATSTQRAHGHLDRVAVLAASLPDSTRLEKSCVVEPALDQRLEGVSKDALVEGQRQSLVATRRAGDTGADVEAHRAAGSPYA